MPLSSMRLSPIVPRAAALVALLLPPAAAAQSTATFRVTLEATWSAQTHPAGFPRGAHFSPLVGVTHDASVAMWAPGAIASVGIELMAERGVTSGLTSEASAHRAAGHADEALVGPAIGTSPGSASMTVAATEQTPLLSLVTMIAPSPDWFVGVHGFDLRPAGAWLTLVDIPLFVYDAGTDSGETYTAADADTQPRAPISRISTSPFAVGGTVPSVGVLRIERLSVTADEAGPGESAFGLTLASANPVRGAAALVLSLDRPQAVTVRVVDALGRTVDVLAEGTQSAGALPLRFDARSLAAGIYTVVAQGETAVATRRLVVAGR